MFRMYLFQGKKVTGAIIRRRDVVMVRLGDSLLFLEGSRFIPFTFRLTSLLCLL